MTVHRWFFGKLICLILGTLSERCGLSAQFHTSVNTANRTVLSLGYVFAVIHFSKYHVL